MLEKLTVAIYFIRVSFVIESYRVYFSPSEKIYVDESKKKNLYLLVKFNFDLFNTGNSRIFRITLFEFSINRIYGIRTFAYHIFTRYFLIVWKLVKFEFLSDGLSRSFWKSLHGWHHFHTLPGNRRFVFFSFIVDVLVSMGIVISFVINHKSEPLPYNLHFFTLRRFIRYYRYTIPVSFSSHYTVSTKFSPPICRLKILFFHSSQT